MLKLLKNICFLKGFRHARAAVARMWPAWYSVSGMVRPASARVSLKKFAASAKVARKAPFDRNVENRCFFKVSASAREQNF